MEGPSGADGVDERVHVVGEVVEVEGRVSAGGGHGGKIVADVVVAEGGVAEGVEVEDGGVPHVVVGHEGVGEED